MKITIVKWEELNPKSDEIRTPNWFRVNKEIGISQSLFALNSAEKWVWILLLATRCKEKNATFSVNVDWFCGTFNVLREDLAGAVRKLSDSGAIEVKCQPTDSPLTVDRHNTAPTYIQNIHDSTYMTQHDNTLLTPPVSGETARTQEFIAAYCRKFKTRWGSNPEIKGKNAGIAKRLAKGWSRERSEILLDAFFAMPDAQLVKAKHPLTLLEYKLNEVTVFADSGTFTTQQQAVQADKGVANQMLLQKIREGKL